MGTTGFSFSFSSTLSSVFSLNMHPILGAVLAGLGFWPKAAPNTPSPAKSQTATPNAQLPDNIVLPAASEKPAAQKTDLAETVQNTQLTVQSSPQTLRVVRFIEADVPAANASQMAGRMVISGRMSDVCAELDRLAA